MFASVCVCACVCGGVEKWCILPETSLFLYLTIKANRIQMKCDKNIYFSVVVSEKKKKENDIAMQNTSLLLPEQSMAETEKGAGSGGLGVL